MSVAWPGWQTTAWHQRAKSGAPQSNLWIGSLVDEKRDASGQLYMRNPYYDPKTGQFTQADPIGLAGGLNVYGFAAGDPVSYSDPYGLCPIPPWRCPPGYFARAGALIGGGTGAVMGAVGGGTAGLAACSPTVVGSVPCAGAGAAAGGAVGARRGQAIGRTIGTMLDAFVVATRSHTTARAEIGRYGRVRVDWEEPTSGGDPGNVHIQNDGRRDLGKVYIKSMDDLEALPDEIKNNPVIRRGVERALEQLKKMRENQ